MRSWWRRIRDWFSLPDPVTLCNRDHVEDHMCWDQLTSEPCPGNEVWFCNKCKRSWTAPNKRKFPSKIDLERRDKDENHWAEHRCAEWISHRAPLPGISEGLEKLRKDRENAKPSNE